MRKFQSTTSIPADTIGFDQTNKNGKKIINYILTIDCINYIFIFIN